MGSLREPLEVVLLCRSVHCDPKAFVRQILAHSHKLDIPKLEDEWPESIICEEFSAM